MEFLRGLWERWRTRAATFAKWIAFSVCIGVGIGLIGGGFHEAINGATALREAHPWLIFLLPLAGVGIVSLYRWCGLPQDPGTNYILVAVRSSDPIHLRMAPLIIVSTVLTHLCGGSSGREGAALQMGGAIADRIGRRVGMDKKDERIVVMCGMAAGFSALFGTPLAAAVFAMEVCSVGVMYYAAIFPCVLCSLLAALTAQRLGCEPTAFALATAPAPDWQTLARVIGFGVLCAAAAILICAVFGTTHRLFSHLLKRPYPRVLLGGALIVLLTLLLGTHDYNGAGMEGIAAAIAGRARPEAFLLKLLLTAITLGTGFKGGEIVPSFFIGATFGCVYGALLGLPAGFAAALGMTAVFCGVTNCPMTSILLSYELFGGEGLPLFALCIAVSYMLSGYRGLYSEQKILYSKYRAEFIDQRAGD